MGPAGRILLASLGLSLFAVTLDDPGASSRPVRAEIATEAKTERYSGLR